MDTETLTDLNKNRNIYSKIEEMEQMEESIELMKDFFVAMERNDSTSYAYQVYDRVSISISGKCGERSSGVKDLLLEDIEYLSKISYLPNKSKRGILLALYDSLLLFTASS